MLTKALVVCIGGIIGLIYMIASPAGPGVFLSLVTPFDALFSGLFGIAGNVVTFLPLVALLLKSSPTLWITQFFGTRIQQLVFVFLLILSVSHALTLPIFPEAAVIEYLTKLTIWLVLGIFAWSMRTPDQLQTVTRVLVLSTVAFTLISMADFYFGIGALPGAAPSTGGVVGATEETIKAYWLRYHGGGLPINRTANWLLVPTFLGFGWFMLADRGYRRLLPIACTMVCAFGILATVSRAGILGALVGSLVLVPTAVGLRPLRILGAIAALATIALAGFLALDQIGFLEVLQFRFAGDTAAAAQAGRMQVYTSVLKIWMTSPLIGVGDSALSVQPGYIGYGAHNSFIGLLAEAGLLGFLPYLGLTILFVYRFSRKSHRVDPRIEAWRPYFFAGFVASMVQNMFNEYTWERLIWFSIAYLIVYERADSSARAIATRERMQTMDFDLSSASAPPSRMIQSDREPSSVV